MIDLTFNLTDNDCELITDDENMIASSIRRLNTTIDTTLYDEYGSTLQGLLGLPKNDINLQFLEQTVNETLLQDDRVTDSNVECEYINDSIVANVTLTYEDNMLDFNYIVGDDADTYSDDEGEDDDLDYDDYDDEDMED